MPHRRKGDPSPSHRTERATDKARNEKQKAILLKERARLLTASSLDLQSRSEELKDESASVCRRTDTIRKRGNAKS